MSAIQLSDHFTYARLLRYTLPSMLMILCSSLYGIVDGVFVSNIVGVTAFSAVNLMMPFMMAVFAIGFMLGSGGSAVVARALGEGKRKEANEYFSMIIVFSLILSGVVAVVMTLLTPIIACLVGAEGSLHDQCVEYGVISFLAAPAFVLQATFQNFFIAGEKPKLSLYVNIAAGVTNVFLDWLLIGVVKMGVSGAALATGIGQCVGALIPLAYFVRENGSLLRLTRRFSFEARIVGRACANGSSEMVTQLSTSVVNTLFNVRLMEYAGENGPAAYGVIMYVNVIYIAIFGGYSMGSAPIASYDYGAHNLPELRNVTKKSVRLMFILGAACAGAAIVLAPPFAGIFSAGNRDLYNPTVEGAQIFAVSYILTAFNTWASAFFTALSNGLVSAVISFVRVFVFQLGCIVIMSELWGITGIWSSVIVAEILAGIVSASFYFTQNKCYHYRY